MPKILTLTLDNYKKIYTNLDLKKMGYERYAISQMVKRGMLEKIGSNIYENLNYDGPEYDFYYVNPRIKEGVVCLLSAAVYYGLSNYWPSEVDVAVRQGNKINNIFACPSFNIYHFGDDRYNLGIVEINDDGNIFKIYDIEKTVIDVIRFRNRIGIEETKEVITNYLKRKDRDLNKLALYSKKLHCEKTLNTYLEVLI